MEKLDRLGWAAAVVGRSHGVRIGVRMTDPAAAAAVRTRLPPTWRDSDDEIVDRVFSLVVGGPDPRNARVRRYNVLYADFAQHVRSLHLEDVLDSLESSLNLFLAQAARRYVFIHAGVVGWKGKALLIPGRTFTGKSTLVAALLRAGATYYSDEYAVLDSRGRVHPYPRRIQLRDEEIRESRHTPAEFGAEVGRRPLPVGLVVASTYRRGARWRPRALTPGQAAMELLANTFTIARPPQNVLATISRVVEEAPVLRGVRGEAEQLAPHLLARMEEAGQV